MPFKLSGWMAYFTMSYRNDRIVFSENFPAIPTCNMVLWYQ